MYKNGSKRIKSDNFGIAKLEERYLNGKQQRKVQYCDPISPLKKLNTQLQWKHGFITAIVTNCQRETEKNFLYYYLYMYIKTI